MPDWISYQEKSNLSKLNFRSTHNRAPDSLRATDHPKDQAEVNYKSGERAKIVAQRYKIILSVGAQMSDLNGNPQAETSVKLPNPFYFIP